MSSVPAPDGQTLVLTREESTLVVAINRPAFRNAITLALWQALTEIFASAAADNSLRAVILTGMGGSFSSGADITEFSTVRASAEQAATYEESVDGCLAAIESAPMPTIAAISGGCVGGGMALALACDFRVADSSAFFLLPPARLGLVYGVPKCQRLAACVGISQAKRLLFSAERFTAAEAASMGLIEPKYEGEALPLALQLAAKFSNSAPLAVAGMKAILNALGRGELGSNREALEQAVARADASADHREAVRAFAEKRQPVFTGK